MMNQTKDSYLMMVHTSNTSSMNSTGLYTSNTSSMNSTGLYTSNKSGMNSTGLYPWSAHYEVTYYNVLSIIYGVVCVIGISGNTFNAVVLGRCGIRRLLHRDRSAHVGFIFLAVADVFVCLLCFPRVFIPDDANDFDTAGFQLYYTLYGTHLVHTFMIMSTWLTVQLAIGRCIIVFDPLRKAPGRHVTGAKTFIICSVLVVIATIFCLPSYWTLKANQIQIEKDRTIFFVDQGPLRDSKILRILSWTYFVFGYALPFVILLFCNICLAFCLIKSDRERRRLTERRNRTNIGSRITPTLISIIIVYMILMTPSEILEFIFDGLGKLEHKTNIYILARSFTNIVQIINYAINFILHMGLNRSYRSALNKLFRKIVCVRNQETVPRNASRSGSMSRVNTGRDHSEFTRDKAQTETILLESTSFDDYHPKLQCEYFD